MVIFYGFDPFIGPNGTPLATKWTLGGLHRDFTVKSNFGRNRWPWGSRIIEFLGHGNFLRFWPIHWTQLDPIGHNVDPRWSTPWFYRKVEFWSKSMTEFDRIWGHGNFLRFWPILWTQWDPIGHKVDPRWSTPWFYRKVEFWSKSMTAG